ncbi:MAG: leucine-rich repeat protein, partial [Oscillospiraceae bacterium]|nr:leucine-rich repeat protein [Oscillospiraceae bacterium]
MLGDIYRDFVNITAESDKTDADARNNKACVIVSKSGMDPYAAGDVDLDGTVGLEDAVLALKCYTRKVAKLDDLGFSDTQQRCADIDKDGIVDVTDAMEILKYYVNCVAKSITCSFPNRLTMLGNSAFNGCTSLQSVIFNDAQITMGTEVFAQCTKLKQITLPKNLSVISEGAFMNMQALEEVKAEGVIEIGKQAFAHCRMLKSFTGSPKLAIISEEAFSDCAALSVLPDLSGITELGKGAFTGCISLTEAALPETLTEVPINLFSGCRGLTKVTLPDTVTVIGNSAFSGCSAFVIDKLPASVTQLGTNAFYGIKTLRDLTLSKDIQYGASVFGRIRSVRSLSIPSDVRLSSGMFSGCSNLVYVCLPDNISNYNLPDSMFANCTHLRTFDYRGTWTEIPDSFFSGCSSLEFAIQPEMTAFGMSAFQGCTGLGPELVIPNNSKISQNAFFGCTGIQKIRFAGNVRQFGESCFSNTSITELSVPKNLNYIPKGAFAYCKKLKEAIIPEHIQKIYEQAFNSC